MHTNTITPLPAVGPANEAPRAATKPPRPTCPAHSRHSPDCAACSTAHADYQRWYRRQAAYGRLPKKVDAVAARDHINALVVRHKVSMSRIATVIGMANSSIQRIATGGTKKLTAETEAKILALDFSAAVQTPDGGQVSSLPTSRRLRALAAIGYSSTYLGKLLDVSEQSVSRWRYRLYPTIRVAHHIRVAALYRELHTRPGPSVMTAAFARKYGYAPPICWDDDGDIDNPAGRPRGYAEFVRLNPNPHTRAGAA